MNKSRRILIVNDRKIEDFLNKSFKKLFLKNISKKSFKKIFQKKILTESNLINGLTEWKNGEKLDHLVFAKL